MRRFAPLVAALVAALSTTAPAAVAADAVPGEIVVRFKGSAGGSERAAARRAARVSLKKAMRSAPTQLVRVEDGQDVGSALSALRRDRHVEHAIPNPVLQATATTDDPEFGNLWGLHNTGQTVDEVAGVADADIDAPEAWDLFNSAPDTVVAVVDTGVRLDHPDLAGNLWTDAEGAHGWDFVDGDADPTDLDGHGTHVAGTIAAQGSNATGISGVAWDAQIMAVRALDENGGGDGFDLEAGLRYAAENGARVVNLSLGGPGDNATKLYYDDLFGDYLGTLFVVAAGNDGLNNEAAATYPCNSSAPNVVCVAATDSKDALAGFSNFGTTSVDLAAPGAGVLSTVPKWSGNVGFADDFSSGLDGWTNTGNTTGGVQNQWGTFTDGWYGGGTNAFLSEKPAAGWTFANSEVMTAGPESAYDLTGREGCVLAWDLYHDYHEGKDGLQVQTSPAAPVSWTTRETYTGSNGGVEPRRLNLKADGSSVRVRLRSFADGTPGPEAAYYGSLIDNFRVQCAAVPDAASYVYFDGTSMATPHVSGVATLLFGARPDASPAQVRAWLLASGDAIPALAGKTVTGRRLNAYNALLAAGVAALVTTGGADDVTRTGATLRGTVNPGGTATEYRFEYGTAPGALTAKTATASAGAGSTAVPVSAALTGLAESTTYHYRLVVIQGGVEHPGAIRTFTTASAPVASRPLVTLAPATGIGTTAATIGGTVDPNGRPATVVLEFGRASNAYTSRTNSLAVDVPSDVSVELTALTPGTTYFFRLRASNADGETVSAEGSFTTLAGTPAGGAPPTAGGTTVSPLPGPNGTPPKPFASVLCKRTRRGKVACRAGSDSPLKVSVRVFRGTRTFARGSANRLTRGKALRMKTVRRVRRGRYQLRLTLVRDGAVVGTITRSIRL